MAGATAVVSNDSGAMHLAGAVGAPVVAVFGATNEHRTSPLVNGPDAARRIVATDVWCRPCMLRECPIDHRCMTGVTAEAWPRAIQASPTLMSTNRLSSRSPAVFLDRDGTINDDVGI